MKKLVLVGVLLFTSTLIWAQKYSKEAKAHNAQAEIHFKTENYSLALEYFLKAENLHPGDPYFAYYAAQCYCKLGYFEEAVPHLENVQKDAKPDKYPDLDYLLGQAYHATMKFDQAKVYFNKHKEKNSKTNPLEVIKADKGIRYCTNGIELVKNPINVKIKNLGNNINSEHPDYNPVLPLDESIIIFTSRREHEIHKGKDPKDDKYFENIYINVKSNDEWTTPTPLGNIINTPNHDACMAISADGNQLFIYMPINGGDIYVSNLLGAIWSEPVSLGTNINSEANESSMSISADGNTIFFTSNRKGGIGGIDIYMSKKQKDGKFGPSILLSTKINTPEDEFSPFVHANGRTLYFSSKGYNSMGGFDIFTSTINIETGEILEAPLNVGYPVNTPGDEIDFVWSADNKRAYFASVREEGFGEEDIYMLEREFISDVSLSIFKGNVFNCTSNLPLQAFVSVTDLSTHENIANYQSNSITGKFVLALVGGKNYNITTYTTNYGFTSKDFNLPLGSGYTEVTDSICLLNISPGHISRLSSMVYDGDQLSKKSKYELDKVVKMLSCNPSVKILIKVYSAENPNELENIKNTEVDAKFIKEYLTQQNVDSKRLFYKGFGNDSATNTTDSPKNRVEIEIMK